MTFSKIINFILGIQHYTYQKNQTADAFRLSLEQVLNHKEGLFENRYGIKGRMKTKSTFKLWKKNTFSLIIIQNFERDNAYMRGKLKEIDGKSIITVYIRPNSIFMIFPIIFIGIIPLLLLSKSSPQLYDLKIWVSLFMGGLIPYLIGQFCVNSLKKKFEELFGVQLLHSNTA